jgi:hypothetical protein
MTKFHWNVLSLLTVQISIFRLMSLYWTVWYSWSFDSIHSHSYDDGIIFCSILKEFQRFWAIAHLPDTFWKNRFEWELASSVHPEATLLPVALPVDLDSNNLSSTWYFVWQWTTIFNPSTFLVVWQSQKSHPFSIVHCSHLWIVVYTLALTLTIFQPGLFSYRRSLPLLLTTPGTD